MNMYKNRLLVDDTGINEFADCEILSKQILDFYELDESAKIRDNSDVKSDEFDWTVVFELYTDWGEYDVLINVSYEKISIETNNGIIAIEVFNDLNGLLESRILSKMD